MALRASWIGHVLFAPAGRRGGLRYGHAQDLGAMTCRTRGREDVATIGAACDEPARQMPLQARTVLHARRAAEFARQPNSVQGTATTGLEIRLIPGFRRQPAGRSNGRTVASDRGCPKEDRRPLHPGWRPDSGLCITPPPLAAIRGRDRAMTETSSDRTPSPSLFRSGRHRAAGGLPPHPCRCR